MQVSIGPDQANQLLAHGWDFTCHVRNVSKLMISRSVGGPANPATLLTLEAPVVNDVATFTVPNYTAATNLISIATKPEYKNKDYFAWAFDWCDIKPLSKLKFVAPLPKP